MFKNRLAVATCAATMWTAVAAAQSTPQGTVAAPNVVVTNGPPGAAQIVTLRAGVDLDGLIKEFGLKPICIYRHALTGFAAPMDPVAIERLRQDGRILAVESDGLVAPCPIWFPQVIPSGIARVAGTNFPVAHINNKDEPLMVDVAVLDTGIDTNHPDLNVVQAAGFADPGLNGQDWQGHGTHVAGIIGARDNTFGVVGVAPGVRLWSVQVIGTTQNAWTNVIAGLDYIAQHTDQIEVVNASLGPTASDNPCTAVQVAVSNIVSQGVVFVAAAGNNNGQDIAGPDGLFGVNPATGLCDDFIPAACAEAMAVSAMDPTNNVIASFSNSSSVPKSPSYVNSPGLGIDVAAPGVHIYSTSLWTSSGYAYMDGTSTASPHAAGLVALYIAANGRATNAAGVMRIRQAIVDSSLPQSRWGVANTMDPDGHPEPLAMASESWVPQPRIVNVALVTNSLQMSFQSVPGYTYAVQYSASLTATNAWTALASTNGSGSMMTVTVADPAPSSNSRFYRLVRQPAP